jgi:glycosyltransferase involved in cell wall biosynthesis
VPGTDAVVQEVDLLRAQFGGDTLWLRPAWRARARYPRELLGLHRLNALRQSDRRVDLHHVYAPELYRLPVLWFLTRPVVYTVTAGVDPARGIPPTPFLRRRLRAIVVPSESDREALARRGVGDVRVIRPGIDVTRFADEAVPPGPGFVLLAGSAPWTREQFASKGVDALLEAARRSPELRLVFLWRGVLLPELRARIRRLELSDRVEVLCDRVDVGGVLRRVHAAVVLAARPGLVKAFPHSLLECLAAGRPVLVSEGNPMAEYVLGTGCGRVVPRVAAADLLEAIRLLRRDYAAHRARALEVGQRDFRQETLVGAHRELYQAVTR